MDLGLTEEAQDFLTYLQQLEFSLADGHDPSQKADIYRNLYLHLVQSPWLTDDGCSRRIPEIHSQWMLEADKYLNTYAKIVDKMDDTGLNNFAEGALAICNFHKNESEKWKTSLTADKILQMCKQNDESKDGVTDVLEDSIITLQSAKITPRIPHFTEQVNIQSKSTCAGDTKQEARLPMQQSSNVLINSAELQVKNFGSGALNSLSSVSGTSHQSVNRGWDGIRATSGDLMDMPRHHPAHGFQNHTQSHGRTEYQTTSPEELSVNTSKFGGPYANFGQKPKSSLWARKKEWMSGDRSQINEEQREEIEVDDHWKPKTFRTAKEQLMINQQKMSGGGVRKTQVTGECYGTTRKSLGIRRGPASKFVPPVLNKDSDDARRRERTPGGRRPNLEQGQDDGSIAQDEPFGEGLRGIEPKMIELINNEIMDHGAQVLWSDIAGLEFAKKTIKEIVVWPMLRPDIFTGLRGPPKGLLLFGPPGTGKTLIGKCIASQSKSTFFCISASSLTSKWVGEGEKMVRALFAVARCHQPAVVFIDEIDSLLSQRSDSEHESSRRIKTEFLVQLDGAATSSEDRILVIGATNRPQEIDEAARRRFVKRLLIPLPEAVARRQIVINLMSQQNVSLSDEDVQAICDRTDGYSGADMTNLCREAALGPIRSIPFEMMETITPDQVRPIMYKDFEEALLQVRASVSSKDLQLYTEWNKTYGSFGC